MRILYEEKEMRGGCRGARGREKRVLEQSMGSLALIQDCLIYSKGAKKNRSNK